MDEQKQEEEYSNGTTSPSDQSADGDFVCHWCDHVSITYTEFLFHRKAHDFSYKCDECVPQPGKTVQFFPSEQSLAKHMEAYHSKDANYECDYP